MPPNPTVVRWLTLGVEYASTAVGGTETYVHRLSQALLEKGVDVHASFYTDAETPAFMDGVPCHAMPLPRETRTRSERFAESPLGLEPFKMLLKELRPTVVHVNAFGAVASVEHVQAAKAAGAKVFATYHSPGFSCPSHALLYRQRTPCDGELRIDRCTRCCLAIAGVPLPLAAVLSTIDLAGMPGTSLPMLGHALERRRGTAAYIDRWHSWMEGCDAITYAADWVRELLLRNDVPGSKLIFLPLPPPAVREVAARPDFWNWAKPGAFRLLCSGRFIDIKGTHIAIDAVRRELDGENIALCLMGSSVGQSDYFRRLERMVAADDRIRIYPPQSETAVLGAHLACDAAIVPSLFPETGPYSVLEAQWLGATIIGSDRAGIAHLLRDYPRGFLFRPGDARALGKAIGQALRQPVPKVAFDRTGYTARFGQALGELLARV